MHWDSQWKVVMVFPGVDLLKCIDTSLVNLVNGPLHGPR